MVFLSGPGNGALDRRSGSSAPGWQGGGGARSGATRDDDNAASRDAGAREPGSPVTKPGDPSQARGRAGVPKFHPSTGVTSVTWHLSGVSKSSAVFTESAWPVPRAGTASRRQAPATPAFVVLGTPGNASQHPRARPRYGATMGP